MFIRSAKADILTDRYGQRICAAISVAARNYRLSNMREVGNQMSIDTVLLIIADVLLLLIVVSRWR
jgi:hypothetical protein